MPSNRKDILKAYMGYSHLAGNEEGACLIFAINSKEARKLAHPIVNDWGGGGWIDTKVRLLKEPHVFDLGNQDKLARNEPHAIEDPKGCDNCELWGGIPLKGGVCSFCE